jgi:hypothetical protein
MDMNIIVSQQRRDGHFHAGHDADGIALCF